MSNNCNHSHDEEERCDCCCCCDEEKELVRDRRELSDEEIEKIISEKYADKDDKTKVFIRKALKKQGDWYDYSKVEYKNAKTKVIIGCPIHGDFEQGPRTHLRPGKPSGCPKCAGCFSYTKELFIEKARSVHGNKYNYDKVDYIDSKTKVTIECPIHGDFEQKPHIHISGSGCPKCASESKINKQKLTTEEFIEKARKIHGDKYNYDKVEYKDGESLVEIICPIHGSFFQIPHSHLKGCGCQKCGIVSTSSSTKSNTEEFIEKARKIHGDKYNYDKVEYNGTLCKVTITCPEHGDFLQRPNAHLAGHGCPLCNNSIGELFTERYLKSIDVIFRIHKHTIINDDEKVIYPDFVLLDLDTWIEYNGEQHYQFIDLYHHDNNGKSMLFSEQIKRDIDVRIYCKINNIRLIEIPYIIKTYEDISSFLNKVLLQNIDPNTLVDYKSLYKLDDTGFKLEDLFPS